MSEIERVEKIRYFLNLNKTEFSKILGYTTPQSYTNFLNGVNNLSMKMLKALKDYNRDISADWILEGQGSMLLSDNNPSTDDIKYLKELLETQRKLIEKLEKEG